MKLNQQANQHQKYYKIVSQDIHKSIFVEIQQFPQIPYQRSEGKLLQYQLLYQGTRDGMNAKCYWSRCNNQSNLLTIMISQNGNKFGGYSPCIINSSLTNYVQDPLKSFLFQYCLQFKLLYNKNETYTIWNKYSAVFCYTDYGPYYGDGIDLFIPEDFKTGSLNLGVSYDISKYNIKRIIFSASQLQNKSSYNFIFL